MNVKSYGKSDAEKLIDKLKRSREIVSEIMNFGVDQEDILKIIHLLSLELENRDAMLRISELTQEIMSGEIEDDGPSIVV